MKKAKWIIFCWSRLSFSPGNKNPAKKPVLRYYGCDSYLITGKEENMKKVFLATIMVIIGMGFSYAQKVTLLTPNGGETLVPGTPMMITWTHSKLTGDETLLIALEGAVDYGPIAYSKVSQGSIEWLAGKKMDGNYAKPASDYRIIIELTDNDSVYDLSDAAFSIVPAAANISLMTPNGGETLEKGMDYDINWSFAGKEGFVSLTLVKDDLPLGPIAENLPAANFRYRWHIGDPLLNGMDYVAGGNYRIQIHWRLRPIMEKGAMGEMGAKPLVAGLMQKNSDRSDNAFSIKEAGTGSQQKTKAEKEE
jgi:hypothetical protein